MRNIDVMATAGFLRKYAITSINKNLTPLTLYEINANGSILRIPI
ncbi:hypothetical protein EDC91_1312 [Shewanella fodinae]|uniref:Uncharacterized protein n=1 Tax=Shewanella fodinae TaxID=552357 RepID=A0A4V2RRP5_9GAMM|nr:hypothetical protein EDC91_1312 [Shewanella fodinae]